MTFLYKVSIFNYSIKFMLANPNSQISSTSTSSLKITQHATFTVVLTNDGGVCDSWQSWERLCLVWGEQESRKLRHTLTRMQLKLPRTPTHPHTHIYTYTQTHTHPDLACCSFKLGHREDDGSSTVVS